MMMLRQNGNARCPSFGCKLVLLDGSADPKPRFAPLRRVGGPAIPCQHDGAVWRAREGARNDRHLGPGVALLDLDKKMRRLLFVCIAISCFAAAFVFNASEANAVFWRGITAPTNIDIHGWPIIKEPPPSPCQWIRLSGGYWVRQCVR